MKGFILVAGVVLLVAGAADAWTGYYLGLGKACDPKDQGKEASKEWQDKVCFPGSKCNAESRICDCADSDDGQWKRTFEGGQCRLLPGSKCIQNIDQDYYRCVGNSKCTVTRVGEDVTKCAADAPCDSGDFVCMCEEGKTCLKEVVPATAA